jgi:hypothetical protein
MAFYGSGSFQSGSSYHVCLFLAQSLTILGPFSFYKSDSLRLRLFSARVLLALITSDSLRLRLFPVRVLTLITSVSLWLQLFPAFLLSVLIRSGSLWLRLPTARRPLALITSGSFQLSSSQLFSTPAHTAWYYMHFNIYTEPGKVYSDTSKALYKEKCIYNLLRKKLLVLFLICLCCCHTEN